MLNPDQERGVKQISRWWKSPTMYMVLDGKGGTGKTYLVNSVIHTLPNCTPLLIAPTHEALLQLREKIQGDYEYRTVASALGMTPTTHNKEVSFVHRGIPSLWENFNLAVIDECFHPEVEVLTDKGFTKFKDLQGDELIANMDLETKLTYFNTPLRYIEKDYEGTMVHNLSNKTASIHTTKNHEQVVLCKGTLTKKTLADVKSTTSRLYCTATSGLTTKTRLTAEERFTLAFQADGTTKNYKGATSYSGKYLEFPEDYTAVVFIFTKQRKIDALRLLLEELGYSYTTVLTKNNKVLFSIKQVPCKIVSKDLSTIFDLTKVDKTYAKDFIEEVVRWDGHIGENYYYYSSTLEDNTSLVQAIAVLGGYRTNKTLQVDTRKDSYKDVHRLFIREEVATGTLSKWKPSTTEYEYKGKVYCVTMPEGTVVVRYNGQVHVSGNCSMVNEAELNLLISIGIKILFIGHGNQLPPIDTRRKIKDTCISPVFNKGWDTFELTIPMRNVGELWDFNLTVESMIDNRKLQLPSTFNTKKSAILEYIEGDKGKADFLSGDTKIAVWSNTGVNKYNSLVRKVLFGDLASKNKYLKGDKVILIKPMTIVPNLETYSSPNLVSLGRGNGLDTLYSNSKATVLCSTIIEIELLPNLSFACYKVKVECLGETVYFYDIVNQLDRDMVSDHYEHLAWSKKSKEARNRVYRDKHFVLSCFATVIHHFAATSHRLQGSSVPNIIVMYSDILRNPCVVERAKCLYVATSRTIEKLMVYKGI